MKTSLEIVSLVGPLILFSFEGATINTFLFHFFVLFFLVLFLPLRWFLLQTNGTRELILNYIHTLLIHPSLSSHFFLHWSIVTRGPKTYEKWLWSREDGQGE